jgi:hypothetical protein
MKSKQKSPKIKLEGNRPMLFIKKSFFHKESFEVAFNRTPEPPFKMVYGDTMEIYAINEEPQPIWWKHKIDASDIEFTKDYYTFIGYL